MKDNELSPSSVLFYMGQWLVQNRSGSCVVVLMSSVVDLSAFIVSLRDFPVSWVLPIGFKPQEVRAHNLRTDRAHIGQQQNLCGVDFGTT